MNATSAARVLSSSPSSADRAAAWRLTHAPRWFWAASDRSPRMPADLATAFERLVLELAARPGTRPVIDFRGERLTATEIVHHVWRCSDRLPRRVASAISCLDPFNPERWRTGEATYAKAAVFLKAILGS